MLIHQPAQTHRGSRSPESNRSTASRTRPSSSSTTRTPAAVQPGWTARPLDEQLGKTLAGQIKLSAKLGLRPVPSPDPITMPGYAQPIVAGAGGEPIEISGDAGEMTLFLMGPPVRRQRDAHRPGLR